MKYSIIIPVYNSEKYLGKCIDSICNQKYEDWELILIDDGSTDKSSKMCDEYSKLDERIISIHQDNAGPSIARNKGIEFATGDFLIFVDSDDWVDDNFIRDYSIYENVDVVYQGFYKDYGGGKMKKYCDLALDGQDIPSSIMLLWERDRFGYTWMKRFRTDIVKTHGIKFDEDIFFREDTIFTAKYFQYVKTIKVLPVANYHYRNVESSLLHTRFDAKEMLMVNDRIIYHFSCYFYDTVFKEFCDNWYLRDLLNGVKKSFAKEQHDKFSNKERMTNIDKCLEILKNSNLKDCQLSGNKIFNVLLNIIWRTRNNRLVFIGLKVLMKWV